MYSELSNSEFSTDIDPQSYYEEKRSFYQLFKEISVTSS